MFSVGSCISFGWETFKKRPWFFIGSTLAATVIYAVIVSVVNSILVQIIGNTGMSGTIETLVRDLFQALLSMGLIHFSIKAHDNVAAVTLSDLWHPNPFWKFIGAYLLVGLVVVIGLILLIVPGIIALVVFMFTVYLVMDKSLGPIQALKESARITKGHRLDLFLLFLISIGILLLGAVCLVVGIFVAIPITMFAGVHAYRTLAQMAPSQTV